MLSSHWDAKISCWRAPRTEIYLLEFLLNATLNIERNSEIKTLGQLESWQACILSEMGLCSWQAPADQQWHVPHSLIQETLLTPSPSKSIQGGACCCESKIPKKRKRYFTNRLRSKERKQRAKKRCVGGTAELRPTGTKQERDCGAENWRKMSARIE